MSETTTHRIVIEQGIGYTGALGRRAYVAAILGLSERYGLHRSFRGATEVTRDHFGRRKYTRTYAYDLTPGLYEVAEAGDVSYRIVWPKTDGTVAGRTINSERAHEIARLMDAGETYDDARRATKAAPAVTTEI